MIKERIERNTRKGRGRLDSKHKKLQGVRSRPSRKKRKENLLMFLTAKSGSKSHFFILVVVVVVLVVVVTYSIGL